jgi:hypothetical protein
VPLIVPNPGYDPLKDFTGVTLAFGRLTGYTPRVVRTD